MCLLMEMFVAVAVHLLLSATVISSLKNDASSHNMLQNTMDGWGC